MSSVAFFIDGNCDAMSMFKNNIFGPQAPDRGQFLYTFRSFSNSKGVFFPAKSQWFLLRNIFNQMRPSSQVQKTKQGFRCLTSSIRCIVMNVLYCTRSKQYIEKNFNPNFNRVVKNRDYKDCVRECKSQCGRVYFGRSYGNYSVGKGTILTDRTHFPLFFLSFSFLISFRSTVILLHEQVIGHIIKTKKKEEEPEVCFIYIYFRNKTNDPVCLPITNFNLIIAIAKPSSKHDEIFCFSFFLSPED